LYENLSLGPLRMLAALVFLQRFLAAVTAFWKPVFAALGWLLVPLGQASLFV
jgi:hypothetical protein